MVSLRRLAPCLLLVCAQGALAARLDIPLRVPFEPVRTAVVARLAPNPARPNEIFREGPCRYLELDAPKLSAGADGRLRLTGPGAGALGVELFGKCQNAAAWRGTMQFVLAPRIDSAGRLRLHIVDSTLTDADGGKPAVGFIWDLSKRYVHPRLERFTYDLGASRAALLQLLRGVAPPAQASAMEQVLQGLQVSAPRVEAADIVVPLALDIPDVWLAAPPPAAISTAPLTEAEIEALEKSLEPWDAFLVYAVRQLALDSTNSALRQRLFTLLLESRYQLVGLLASDAPPGGDPLRTLFVDTWNELRTILADAQREGALDASLLRYALFVDSGDALLALEKAAPGLQMRPSVESLRQLARTLRPGTSDDPLAYDESVDPQLKELFSVEEPAEAAPQPREEPQPAPPPTRSWLDLFVTRAYAQSAPLPSLDRWVPTQSQLPAYETRVGALLVKTSAAELERASFSAPYDGIYRNLVPTTALIESCWHQYVARGGKVTYLRSGSGSIGIMQINQHVWRGFYSLERLRWDTAYNIRAGAQILVRYVKDYAIPYAEKTGNPNHVPRAAYAVYNAGPRAVGRFNKAERHPREARVDDRLWSLYQGLAAGGQADLASCGVKGSKTALQ